MTTALEGGLDPKKQGNVLIGERVHTLMWRNGRTQKQLADILKVDQGSISKRLRGNTVWSAVEIAAVAAWLGVPVEELLPEVEVTVGDDPSEPYDGDPPDGAPTRARVAISSRDVRSVSEAASRDSGDVA
jgi:transcriptional regulator with XRE-family HTH domain